MRDRLDNIRAQQRTLGQVIARAANEIAQHAADPGKPGAADTAGRAKTRIQDATGQLRQLDEAFRRTVREESLKELEAIKLRKQREECRSACPDAHAGTATAAGNATSQQTATSTDCRCSKLAADLKTKRDQLNKLNEELNDTVIGNGIQWLQTGTFSGTHRQEVLEGRIKELAAEVEGAEALLKDCDDTCAPPTPISHSYSRPLILAGAGGAAMAALLVGGGDSTPVAAPIVQQPTPVPSTPSSNTPSPPSAPQPPPITPTTGRFQLIVVSHPAGASTSLICGLLQIDPPVPGVTFVLTGTGPAVLPNQTVTGTFNANGLAAFRLGIGQTGIYTLMLVINNQGSMQTLTASVNVSSAGFNCPSLPS